MGWTLLLFFIIFINVSTTIIVVCDKIDEIVTWALPCRRCRSYIKVGSGGAPTTIPVGAPPDDTSSGNKTNVGAFVGFTFLLVFIIVGVIVCIVCLNRGSSRNPRVTIQQPAVVQPSEAQELRQSPARPGLAKPSGGPTPVKKEVVDEVTKPKDEVDDKDARPERPNVGQGKGDIERGDDKKKEVEEEVIEPKREEVRCQGKHGKDNVKGKRPQEVVKEQGNSLGSLKKYTYEYLTSVTNNFDVENNIGGGAFGTVYRGEFVDGTIVAVKWLKYERKIDDFKNEVEALGTADHPNLVKLIGYCDEGTKKMLVYEYMKNGSLDKWIFKSDHNKSLNWPEMKNIIRGIAQGLEYLHEKRVQTILHRDLKPPNVILDDDKNAKLCDFGLAKLMSKEQSSTSTLLAGTMRYMAPEVLRHKRITEKVDVYSFGIVMLEVLFGKRYYYLVNSDQANNSEVINLTDLIQKSGEDMRRNGMEIKEFGNLAIHCINEKPEERPSMSKVVAAIRDLEAGFKEAKAGRN